MKVDESLPPANEVWGKVMFLLLFVSHSVHSGHRSGWYASYQNAYLFLKWFKNINWFVIIGNKGSFALDDNNKVDL